MALAIATIADSIAAVSVSGVTIKDLNEIPEAVTLRDCPVLFPRPDGFVTDLAVKRDSFGTGAVAKMTVTYILTYTFCHAPIGSGRGLFDVYDNMIANAFAIIDAIITNDTVTGLVDLQVDDALNFGPVEDPSGNVFHGCEIQLYVMEFVN